MGNFFFGSLLRNIIPGIRGLIKICLFVLDSASLSIRLTLAQLERHALKPEAILDCRQGSTLTAISSRKIVLPFEAIRSLDCEMRLYMQFALYYPNRYCKWIDYIIRCITNGDTTNGIAIGGSTLRINISAALPSYRNSCCCCCWCTNSQTELVLRLSLWHRLSMGCIFKSMISWHY